MARSIISVFMVVLLVIGLAVSVCAAGSAAYDFADSGVQVFAAPQRVASAPLAAADTASATAGEYGYNFLPVTIPCQYQPRTNNTAAVWIPSGVYDGHYYFVFTFSSTVSTASSVYVNGQSSAYPCTKYVDGNSAIFDITFDNTSAPSGISFFVSFPDLASNFSLVSYDATRIIPVEGISSGFTGSFVGEISSSSSGSILIDASFGKQPAGEYLVNIYHDAANCLGYYELSYGYPDSRRIASKTDGGITTAIVSHGGGDFDITGSVDIRRPGSGYTYPAGSGTITVVPGSFSYTIHDIVIVPLSNSSVEQYGFFGPLIGFLRDAFHDLFSSDQNDAGGEFEQGTSQASDLAGQQEQLEQEIIGGFNDASGNVDPSAITIPNDVISGFAFLSELFMLVFNGLGNYKVLVTVPLCIGIALICIGRGFNAADRALRSETYHNRRAARKGG